MSFQHELSFSHEDISPPNEEITPSNDDIEPSNEDVKPSNEDVKPSNEDVKPSNEDVKRSNDDIIHIATDNAFPVVGPYSQAVRAGPYIFVSGQIPGDASGTVIMGNIGIRTAACCNNIKAILAEAGVGLDRVVKTTVFLREMGFFPDMNAMYERYFPHRPARSCVAVKDLPKGVPVEIECIALA